MSDSGRSTPNLFQFVSDGPRIMWTVGFGSCKISLGSWNSPGDRRSKTSVTVNGAAGQKCQGGARSYHPRQGADPSTQVVHHVRREVPTPRCRWSTPCSEGVPPPAPQVVDHLPPGVPPPLEPGRTPPLEGSAPRGRHGRPCPKGGRHPRSHEVRHPRQGSAPPPGGVPGHVGRVGGLLLAAHSEQQARDDVPPVEGRRRAHVRAVPPRASRIPEDAGCRSVEVGPPSMVTSRSSDVRSLSVTRSSPSLLDTGAPGGRDGQQRLRTSAREAACAPAGAARRGRPQGGGRTGGCRSGAACCGRARSR